MKRIKQILPIIIAFIIGISTTVGAVTVFNSKDITYSSSATSKKNVKEALDELYNKVGQCPIGLWCYNSPMTIADKVELGDYIRMTPTSTSYTISNNLTGYTSDQTINPSELDIWRVIKKNDDGSIIALSEYISNTQIHIRGETGFKNLDVLMINIGNQYVNKDYALLGGTIGSYGNNHSCSTIINCLGDSYYKEELDLISKIQGISLIGLRKSKEKDNYWTSSRVRFDDGKDINADLLIKVVSPNNGQTFDTPIRSNGLEYTQQASFRPEIRLKANVKIKNGDGKSEETAYNLE